MSDTTNYVLRYCYRYEPSFDVHSLWDIILYKDCDEINGETYDYLRKEDELTDKEDELQIFFRSKYFTYSGNPKNIQFLKLELFPRTSKDDSVLNLVFIPLEKGWHSMTNLEQLLLIDSEVKNQEKEIDIQYKLVNYSIQDIEVQDTMDSMEDESDDYSKADELED